MEPVISNNERAPREKRFLFRTVLRCDSEFLVAFQGPTWSNYAHKASRGADRNYGRQIRIGHNSKSCSASIEENRSCACESLSENLDGPAHFTRARQQTDKWP